MTGMLDSNIIIYHLMSNHPEHSPASSNLFRNVRLGEIDVYCPSTAILECTYILSRTFGAPRDEIAPLLGDIISISGVHCEHKPALLKSLVFWQRNPPLDFADCYHLALARELGITQVYTFHKKMDRYPGVERIEPEAANV